MKINGLITGIIIIINDFRFGFSEECATRLGEDPNEEDSIFARVNKLFEYFPLAAVVEEKIICLHGGIGFFRIIIEGSQLNYVNEIENL